jgi:hypothetical protein
VAVAVKVRFVPAQTLADVQAILTLALVEVLTVTVIAFDVAGEPVAQERLEVMIQLTTSFVTSVFVVNVALLLPTLAPLTSHW